MTKKSISAVTAGLLAMLIAGPAFAQSYSLIGTWTVVSSSLAPWVKPEEKPLPSDDKALLGHRFVFTKDKATAPSPPLEGVCQKPHYELSEFPPSDLFEGSLPDPEKQAAALGFTGKTIPTIETGCEGVTDFHFLNADAALFGLNDRVYRIERKTH